MTDHLAFCCYLQQSRVSFNSCLHWRFHSNLTPQQTRSRALDTHTHGTISIQDQFSLSSVDIRLNQTIMSIMLRGDRHTFFTTHNSITLLENFHSCVTRSRFWTLSIKLAYLLHYKGVHSEKTLWSVIILIYLWLQPWRLKFIFIRIVRRVGHSLEPWIANG